LNSAPRRRYEESKKASQEDQKTSSVEATREKVQSGPFHIAEGTRLYVLARRPTKADFTKVYGPKGPSMTWVQRAKAGVDAKHFQEALKAKS
jgi:hypothetical protein